MQLEGGGPSGLNPGWLRPSRGSWPPQAGGEAHTPNWFRRLLGNQVWRSGKLGYAGSGEGAGVPEDPLGKGTGGGPGSGAMRRPRLEERGPRGGPSCRFSNARPVSGSCPCRPWAREEAVRPGWGWHQASVPGKAGLRAPSAAHISARLAGPFLTHNLPVTESWQKPRSGPIPIPQDAIPRRPPGGAHRPAAPGLAGCSGCR